MISDKEQTNIKDLQNKADKASRLLKALSNPDRLLLLCRLNQGELCVGTLETETGVLQPTLSQQLTVLREERLVATRREGKQIFYRIDSKEALAVIEVLHRLYCGDSETA